MQFSRGNRKIGILRFLRNSSFFKNFEIEERHSPPPFSFYFILLFSFPPPPLPFLRPSTETRFRRVSSLLVHAENNSGKRKSRDNDRDRDLEQRRGRAVRNYFVKNYFAWTETDFLILLAVHFSRFIISFKGKEKRHASNRAKSNIKFVTIRNEELIFFFSRLSSLPPLFSFRKISFL